MGHMARIAVVSLLVAFTLLILACGKKGPPTLNDYRPKTKFPVSATEQKQTWTADGANLQGVASFILTESIEQNYVLRSNT